MLDSSEIDKKKNIFLIIITGFGMWNIPIFPYSTLSLLIGSFIYKRNLSKIFDSFWCIFKLIYNPGVVRKVNNCILLLLKKGYKFHQI